MASKPDPWQELSDLNPAVFAAAQHLANRYPPLGARAARAGLLVASGAVSPNGAPHAYHVASQSHGRRVYLVSIHPDDPEHWTCTIAQDDAHPEKIGDTCPDIAHETAPLLAHGRRCKHMAAAFLSERLPAPLAVTDHILEAAPQVITPAPCRPVGPSPRPSAPTPVVARYADGRPARRADGTTIRYTAGGKPVELREASVPYTLAITDDELYRMARTAAYSAESRLPDLIAENLTPADRDDMTQAAAIGFWQGETKKNDLAYAYAAARGCAIHEVIHNLKAHNPSPHETYSFDAGSDDDDPYPWYEKHAAPPDDPTDQPFAGEWCDLHQVRAILRARIHPANTIRPNHTETGLRHEMTVLLLLLANPLITNREMARRMGSTEGAIKETRRRIKHALEAELDARGIPIPEWTQGTAEHIRIHDMRNNHRARAANAC